MRKMSVYPKVITDMFWMQLFWAFGFLGVTFMIHLIKMVIGVNNGSEVNSYFDSVFIPANIFMLVIGIISVYGFLKYYVSNGVTRKDYFTGAAIASAGLSIALPVIASVITAIELFIVKMTGLFEFTSGNINQADLDNNLITEIVQSIIFSPFVDLESNFILAILTFSLNVFTYYLIGWLIGAGFYRFGVLVGLGCILLSLAILSIQDSLLRSGLDLPGIAFYTIPELPLFIAILVLFIIFAIMLWMIRQFTKRVTVKL